MMKNLHFSHTKIKDGFWKYYDDLVRRVTVHSVYEQFLNTGRFNALRCDWRDGEPNRPHLYWDSDVAKWIEGAAYLIETQKEPELEQKIDDAAAHIARNQRDDGYFNSYFLSVDPSKIYSDRNAHELYCTGHLIEAATAYHRATEKDTLLCKKMSAISTASLSPKKGRNL